MNSANEIQAFEKAILKFYPPEALGRTNGTYDIDEINIAWQIWQAAKSHEVVYQSGQVNKENIKAWLLNSNERVLTKGECEHLNKILGMENAK